MEKLFCVYIMASRRNGTLYVGVTSDLAKRAWEHREGLIDGFTKTYGVKLLVWNQVYPTALEAIAREKRIKRWRRAWKIALIEAQNPQWLDQSQHLFSAPPPYVIPGDPQDRPGTQEIGQSDEPSPLGPGSALRFGRDDEDL